MPKDLESLRNLIPEIVRNLDGHSEKVRKLFGALSHEQLAWQPNPDSWGIGKIFEHLVTAHRAYFPLLEQLADGTYKAKLWTRISPFSGMFGRMLVNQMGPEAEKKHNAPPAFRPTTGQVPEGILTTFLEDQEKIKDYLHRLDKPEILKQKIASPAGAFITYRLADAIVVLDLHEARHISQAKRVLEMPQFPSRAPSPEQ